MPHYLDELQRQYFNAIAEQIHLLIFKRNMLDEALDAETHMYYSSTPPEEDFNFAEAMDEVEKDIQALTRIIQYIKGGMPDESNRKED